MAGRRQYALPGTRLDSDCSAVRRQASETDDRFAVRQPCKRREVNRCREANKTDMETSWASQRGGGGRLMETDLLVLRDM